MAELIKCCSFDIFDREQIEPLLLTPPPPLTRICLFLCFLCSCQFRPNQAGIFSLHSWIRTATTCSCSHLVLPPHFSSFSWRLNPPHKPSVLLRLRPTSLHIIHLKKNDVSIDRQLISPSKLYSKSVQSRGREGFHLVVIPPPFFSSKNVSPWVEFPKLTLCPLKLLILELLNSALLTGYYGKSCLVGYLW